MAHLLLPFTTEGSMSEFLTTWKGIAAYLGKGVRTVQRWEEELDLPVRRPVGSDRNAIFALRPEIDEWMKVRTGVKAANQLALFRERIEILEAENKDLRAQVASRGATWGVRIEPSEQSWSWMITRSTLMPYAGSWKGKGIP